MINLVYGAMQIRYGRIGSTLLIQPIRRLSRHWLQTVADGDVVLLKSAPFQHYGVGKVEMLCKIDGSVFACITNWTVVEATAFEYKCKVGEESYLIDASLLLEACID